jgi:outer membrane protein assembly factor BamB
VLWQELLIGTFDVDHRSLTVALDKATGEVRWEADRSSLIDLDEGEKLFAYSTPIILGRGAETQLVHHANGYLCGYQLFSGKELWHFQSPGHEIVPSPVFWKDVVIIGGGAWLARNKCLVAVRLGEKGQDSSPHEVWKIKRNLPEESSPVVYQDLVYLVTKRGVATCLEAASGKVLWKERLPGEYSASVTAGDGKVFFCNTEGVTSVLEAGRGFCVLARNPIGESVQASLAISGGNIFIRGETHMFCIGPEQQP